MKPRTPRKLEALTLALAGALMTGGSLAAVGQAPVGQAPVGLITFSTQLTAISSEHYNGREFLTIRIADRVGPATCRGNVLKVNVSELPSAEQRDELETVAFSAMLNANEVMISVPMGYTDCIDGKPTVADMHLLITR